MTRQRGIFCPACHAPKQHPYAHRRPMAGLRIRYFKCHQCGVKFRTKERIMEPPNGR